MAREQVDEPWLWDDCVQEAAIHDWQLRERKPGQTEAYYNKAARRRIVEVARTGLMTGMPTHQGHPVDPLRRRRRTLSLDAPLDEDASLTLLDTIHDYDSDREVPLTEGGAWLPQERCKSGRHLMSETRMGTGRSGRCRACWNKRRREARRRRLDSTSNHAID